jgi:hypothetical protein|tara:strand:- start:103 stop:486 length:384 start_codon:yes stop_codon:yes gene_type:complete
VRVRVRVRVRARVGVGVRVRARVRARVRVRVRVRGWMPWMGLLAVEAPLELDDLILDWAGLQLVHEDTWVDPDGESVHRRRAARRVAVDALVALGDALRTARAEHARARRVEMPREVVDVEAAPGTR